MSLKDIIESDINDIYLNLEDFGEKHVIDGREITWVEDSDELKARQGSNDLSVTDSSLLFFAKSDQFPKQKPIGEKLIIDGRVHVIDDWKSNFGVSEIAVHELVGG